MTDDEIAVASRLADMARLVAAGEADYPFAETLHNCALTSLIHQAGESGAPLRSGEWPWLSELRG
jgi:hypothetical protein